MNDSEIQEIAALLPAPEAPGMGADRSRALRAHLVTELRSTRSRSPRRARPSRRLWTGLGVAGAVGAAAAVAATVLVASPSPSHGGRSAPANGTALTAATLLAKVADAAARQPAPTVRDDEFMYIRSEV